MTTETIAQAFGLDHGTLSPASHMLAMIEKIHWNKPADGMPDAEETVLIFSPSADEPVWLGYHDGTKWRLVDGFPLADNEVTFWAPMPGGPK